MDGLVSGYRDTDLASVGTLARHAPEEAILTEHHPAEAH